MDVEAAIRETVRSRRLRVPPAPTACLQLSDLLSRDGWSLADVERIVRADPATTAVVLRVVNSVAHRAREAITSLPTAVGRLGAKGVLRLAWGSMAGESVERTGPLRPLRVRAWREALVAANVARWLAGSVSPLDEETSFVVGMLHDVGRLVVLSALEETLEAHPDSDTRTLDGWWALVEDLHVPAGAALVEAWSLPHPLAAAVAFHHHLGAWDWLQVVREVVEQVEGSPHVTASALGAVASLGTAQCVALANRLPELVDAVRLLDPALPAGAEEDSPFELGAVSFSAGDAVHRATLLGVEGESLVVSVEAPFESKLLVFVRVGTLQFHARVEGGGTEVRLLPWALTPAQYGALEAWRQDQRSAA